MTSIPAGPGTYLRNNQIYASALGTRSIEGNTLSISNDFQGIPEIGSIILGKVTRIDTHRAHVSILSVNDKPLSQFQGLIKSQDVRQTQIDSVSLPDCFRPGDIIRAQVIGLGDARSFQLSTAQNELGVVLAHSEAGFPMVPIDWENMLCPSTNLIEPRKCAQLSK